MSNKPGTERLYSLDWLRIVLILSVFFFHIGLVFSTHNWPVKNDIQFPFLKPIMGFLTLWRMPLLFLVSGIGTQFALGSKGMKKYFENRSIKLLIPYVAGLFILLPIQVYYERIPQYDSLLSLYQNLFNGFYPVGNFSVDHHLWFIKYLYLISLVSMPLLLLINDRLRFKMATIASRSFSGKISSNW
jgi:peptidoglycan/LPS O-acetylase OafA/YrhL